MFALAACAALWLATQEPPTPDVQALRRQIAAERDAVPAEVIAALAEIGTREAAEALIASYDDVVSIWMRREIVRALARCAQVPEAAEIALGKLAAVALAETAPELHEEAIDLLAADRAGRPWLREIAGAPADAAVRERAMLRHVETWNGDEDDLAWYRELFEDAPDRRAPDAPRGPPLIEIRELALTRLAPGMKDAELVELAREKPRDRFAPELAGIRRLALDELVARDSQQARALAEEIFEDVLEISGNRAAAARHLLALEGSESAKRFIAAGRRDNSVMPMGLRMALADLLAEMDHEPSDKKLAADLARARGAHALFCLRALGGQGGAAPLDELLERVGDRDLQVRLAAIAALAGSASPEAAEALEGLLDGEEPRAVLVAALESLSALRAGDPAWRARLVEFTARGEPELRNSALRLLGAADAAAHAELFVEALGHPDWSTRLTALRVLEGLRTPAATGAIVARMGLENGLMQRRFGESLWRLSGQPFGTNAAAWKRWWDDAGDGFEPIDPAELERRAAQGEELRLRESTKAADFFGLRIESKRVLFILDVSGSMEWPLAGPQAADEGETRMQLAKREMIEVLASLEPDALFDLITFSDAVAYWSSAGVQAASPETVAAVIEFVERLGTGGGTNLYGALREAFGDPDVDMLVLLSDGQPEGGEIDDPHLIRTEVATWNKHRHITIHTVAIGAKLEILEWLALDSGGRHVWAR